MHVFKWTNPRYYIFCAPDGVGGVDGGSGGGDSLSGDTGGGDAASVSVDGGEGSPSVTPSSTPDSDVNPWDALGSTEDLDYQEEPPVVPVIPPVAPAPVAAEAPVAPPAATPPAATPATLAPEGQTPPAPTNDGSSAPMSPADPVSIANAIEANRDAIVQHLATSKFALTPADIEELETDVTAAVPKLLAKVFLESQVGMQRFVAQSVPAMMQNYNKVNEANTSAEQKFFAAHKMLDSANPQHRETVTRLATMYRQMNPQMPLDQLIADVGPMAAQVLKLNAPAQTVPRATTPPFRPAVGGGGGAPNGALMPVSEWDGMGMTFDDS